MASNNFQYTKQGQQFLDTINTRIYSTSITHPLIQNSQEYIYYKKFVAIHSEDRDMLKYPSASDFEIELPEDLLNVAALKLYDWSFPSNYSTFSNLLNNVTMTFLIDNPYNPNINNYSSLLSQKIFECLFYSKAEEYSITIEPGFYSPTQMATELTNKLNTAVTNRIIQYFKEQSSIDSDYTEALSLFNDNGGYNNFVVVYNVVGIKLWFGNISDGFTLTNETQFINSSLNNNLQCGLDTPNPITIPFPNYRVPEYANWGLPGYLGLSRCNTTSINGSNISNTDLSFYNGEFVPRFYYGDALNPGDNGYWLLPNTSLPNSSVHWIEAPYKINIMGPSYMYMEIDGQNCIDETKPYNISPFTMTTNETNGVVNSAFARISVPTTPLSQWFDKDSGPYKFYYPPAERMRKFHIRLRYHNGQLVDFGIFNFSFTIEFTIQLPQILREYKSKLYPTNL